MFAKNEILGMKNDVNLTIILSFLFVSFSITSTTAQSLNNPSFEDEPSDATVPMGWFPCAKHTTPDILPGYWGVYEDASDGETFVGLITRENSTYESIGQRISKPLKANNCYAISMDLAHSNHYSGYNQPLGLRVYVSDEKCDDQQLVKEIEAISHEEWKTYKLDFYTESAVKYILIEAFYKDGRFSHKGNILIDNIKAFFDCSKT